MANIDQDGALGGDFDFDAVFDAAGPTDQANDAPGEHGVTLALDLGLAGLAQDAFSYNPWDDLPSHREITETVHEGRDSFAMHRQGSPFGGVNQRDKISSDMFLDYRILESNIAAACRPNAVVDQTDHAISPSPPSPPPSPPPPPREADTARRRSDVSAPFWHPVSSLSAHLSPIGSSQSQPRLPDFKEAWMWILHPQHPMIDVGRQILQDLDYLVHLEHSVDLWCYTPNPEHPQRAVELTPYVHYDLDALVDVPENAIIADQRALPIPPLTNGWAARAALRAYLPVAFDVPHQSERGMRCAPDMRVPHYTPQAVRSTVVAGSGTLLAPRRSTCTMPTVLHVVLGQIVLIHLPLTHANERGPAEGCCMRQQFLWALSQPAVLFRVLYPGESAFLPPMHWYAMIALGNKDSSFAAAVLSYVQRVEEIMY